MTTEEMRILANHAGNQILIENAEVGMTNKLAAIIWTCCAEICDRLDLIANQLRNKTNG